MIDNIKSIKYAKKNKKNLVITPILILIVIALAVVPILILKDAEFAGADTQAEQAIIQMNADYKPWFSPFFEPKSGEIETLLFALQAAIGSGIVLYGLGYMKGRSKITEVIENKEEKKEENK